MRKDIKNRIEEVIENCLESALESREYDEDWGNEYAACCLADGWCFNNGKDRLTQFIADNEVDCMGMDIDAIEDLVLNNYELVSRHLYSGVSQHIFNLDSWAVGEVEDQISFEFLTEQTGLNITAKRLKALDLDLVGSVSNEDLLAYSSSDMIWCAEISAAELQSLIEENCPETEEE